MKELTIKGEAMSFSQIDAIWKEWLAPIYVTPSSFICQKDKEMHGVIGMIYFVEDSCAIWVDWTIDDDKKRNKICPNTEVEKYFCSDIRILWHPGMNTDIPDYVLNRLGVSYRPKVNKILNDVVVINPRAITDANNLSQYKKHIGIVKPINNKAGCVAGEDIMVIMSPANIKYDSIQGKNTIDTPNVSNWIKLSREQCLCIPSSFCKYIGMTKKPLDDGTNTLVINKNSNLLVESTSTSTNYTPKSKFKIGDIVSINWSNEQLIDKRLMGMVGIVDKIERKNNKFFYTINFDTVPNQSLVLCKDIDPDILKTVEIDEYCLSDMYANKGYITAEQIQWRVSVGADKIRTAWDMTTKKPVIVTSLTDSGVVYTKQILEDNKVTSFASELRNGIRGLDYNYDAEKLKAIIESVDLLIPAIETHNKQQYVYVYGFDEFAETTNLSLRILLGRAVDKRRNIKKLKKWMENVNGQSITSVLKYIEPKFVGNIFHTLDKVYLTTLIFKEAK